MFTGLVEEIGTVRRIRYLPDGLEISVFSSLVIGTLSEGSSVAIDGVCQTVTSLKDNIFTVEAVGATLLRTSFKDMKPGKKVNLERPVAVDGRLEGHIVQGHVEGTGRIKGVFPRGDHSFIAIYVPQEIAGRIIQYGSVAVDGVSLTVAEVSSSWIGISVIPHTLKNSTLGDRKPGDQVNIETDVLAKYSKLYDEQEKKNRLSESVLRKWGY